jgi:general secretion pathway protein A
LFWKPPDFYTTAINPGDSGPAITWLARSLADLGLYTPNGSELRLDGQLLGALKRYQLAAGLIPDGMLGPQTLIHLLNALGHEEPLLKAVEVSN